MKKIVFILLSIFLLFGCSANGATTENKNTGSLLTKETIINYLNNEKLETKEDWLLFLGIHGLGFDDTASHVLDACGILDFLDIEYLFTDNPDASKELFDRFKSTNQTLFLLRSNTFERHEIEVIKVLDVNEKEVTYSGQILYYEYNPDNAKYEMSKVTIPALQIITIPKEYKIENKDGTDYIVFENCKIMISNTLEYVSDPKLDDSFELYYEGPLAVEKYSSISSLVLIEENPVEGDSTYKLLSRSNNEFLEYQAEKQGWNYEDVSNGYAKFIFTEKDTRAKENMEDIFKNGKGSWTINFIQETFGMDNMPFKPDGQGGFFEGELTGEGYLTCDKFYDEYCTMHFRLGTVEADFDLYYKDLPHVLIEDLTFKSSGPNGYGYVYGSLDLTYNE